MLKVVVTFCACTKLCQVVHGYYTGGCKFVMVHANQSTVSILISVYQNCLKIMNNWSYLQYSDVNKCKYNLIKYNNEEPFTVWIVFLSIFEI